MVVSILPAFTTRVDAAVATDLPYQVWFPDTQILAVSDAAWMYENYGYSSAAANKKYAYNREGVCELAITSNSDGTYYSLVTSSANSYLLTYVEGVGWSSTPTNYWYSQSEGIAYYCIASKSQTFTFYSSHTISGVTSSGTIPSTLPDGSNVEDLINDQLNSQTATGTQAAQIITDTTAMYGDYQAGTVDTATMQSYVTSNLDTLSELSATTGNTLSDLMQINNAITYNQAIQDGLLHTASGNIQSMITGYTNTINTAVANYQSGTTSQADTVTIIQQQINNLNQLITNGTATTTADINAVNAAINAANGSLDSVTGYQDLSQEVSEKSQQSDAEELELLNEMVSVMQQEEIENPMQDQQTMDDAVAVRDSISDIWINKYMLALSAFFGMLVIPCILLRTHYRMM